MKINAMAIEVYMAKQQLSLKSVAERAGMTAQGIYNALQAGRATPPTVGKIAAGLGVPVEDILADAKGHA